MSEKIVLAISCDGANNAIRGLMLEFGSALAAMDVPVVQITLDPGELQYAVDQMASGEVRFAMTWLGVGQEVAITAGERQEQVNVWDALGVPLVKIHADSPAYFSDRHRDTPRTSVNLYMAQEFLHFRRRWMPEARTLAGVLPPWPISPLARDRIDLAKRRTGALVFLKNGNSPSELQRLWKQQLSTSVSGMLEGMAESIRPIGLRPGVLHIGDFVADFLTSKGVDVGTATYLIPFFTAQLDDYLRRLKSTMIANALLDFPVIVQGSAWDHVDFAGRKARLVGGQDFITSREIFTDQLGIIDMSPNMDSEPHERVQRGAGCYSLMLTNRQSWLANGLPGFDDLQFEFTPDSIAARIADVLAHRERYLEMGVAFGDSYREVYPQEAFAQRVIELADLASLQWARERPRIQPFFIWPTVR